MANRNYDEDRPSFEKRRKGGSLASAMIYIAVLLLAGVFLMKYWKGDLGTTIGNMTLIPKDMQVTYVPAEFHPSIDEENALAILSNPQRYRREFDQLVFDFNMDMINHVAKRMNLPDSTKLKLKPEYEKHHLYIKEMYYKDFVAMQDTSANLYQAWYNNEGTNAVALMTEVASKYSCSLVIAVISTLVKTEQGKLSVKGENVDTPCGIAMNEVLKPMMKRLEDRAAIEDFSKSKGMFQEKLERSIAELGTMEVRDKKGLSKQLQTKVLDYAVSSTDLEISAISILKVGFKLDRYFNIDMDDKKKAIVITLPEPEILSHEVYPKVEKLDIGWLREVTNADFNKNFNALRAEFRREAGESDIFIKSKKQATSLLETMMLPMVQHIRKGYKLQVKFKHIVDFDPEEEPLTTPPKKEKKLDN